MTDQEKEVLLKWIKHFNDGDLSLDEVLELADCEGMDEDAVEAVLKQQGIL